MLFAFSRDRAVPGPPVWRKVSRHRVPVWSVLRRRRARLPADAADVLEQPRRLLRRHVGRHDRPLHRVHPPGLSCAGGRATLRARRVEPREALQVDQPARDPLGRLHLGPLHAPDRAGGIPWNAAASTGTSSTTHRSRSAAPSCSSAAGGCCRRKNWFKGPVRMGTEEELEQLEAEQEDSSCCQPTRGTRPEASHQQAARGAEGAPRASGYRSRRRRSGRSPAR